LVIGRSGEPYNIGVESPEISMADLAERLIGLGARHLGYKGKLVRQVSPDRNYLVDNPNRRCPVIAKARAELNYNPSISLETGLERSLLWYRENNEASDA
jgi:UDP-glucuronate decarboxylase